MLSLCKNQECIYVGKHPEYMLSARGVNTSVRPMTSFQFGCRGLTHKAGVGVSRWTSAFGKALVERMPKLVVYMSGLSISPLYFIFQVRKTQQW